MRRKDILIIITLVILIAFATVFLMYWIINDGNIFSKMQSKVEEIEVSKKLYHSNGWETAIVEKIIDGVPVPVGFTYIEGDKETGIIIEDNATQEKYIWVPNQEVGNEVYTEILAEDILKGNTESSRKNLQKYDGFYVAISEEGNKPTLDILKEMSPEEFEILEAYNSFKTNSVEAHLMTAEELALINKINEGLENKIKLSNYRVLTVLGGSITNNNTNEQAESPAIIKQKKWNENIIGNVKKEEIKGKTYYVPIPKGFEYKEGTIKTGFKIKNTDNLSFIWIPVEDVNSVKNTFITRIEASNLVEADTIEAYKKYADNTESNEYKELVASIETYGGFYISEAELGYDEDNNDINVYRDMIYKYGSETYNYVSNGDYYRHEFATYKDAVDICGNLYRDSETVNSHLTYGLEYDATVLYLLNNCEEATENIVFADSTSVGKYQYYFAGEEGNRSLWEKEFYLNGIYGLAGNLAEITQEKDGDNLILRGGSWTTTGNSETLASKSSVAEAEMDKDDNENMIGSVGFRACLYIKTKYEQNQNLANAKEKAKQNIINMIDGITINKAGEEYYSFKTKNSKGQYEIVALNEIIKYANNKIDMQTSSEILNKIVSDVKKQVETIKSQIYIIINYPDYTTYPFTYGETEEECNKIKEETVQQIKSLRWSCETELSNSKFFNKNNEEVVPTQITSKAVDEIVIIRNAYKDKIYNEEIEEYITNKHSNIANKIWVSELKKEAKKEINNTEDLENIKDITKMYQERLDGKILNSIEIGQNVNYIPNDEESYLIETQYSGTMQQQIISKETLKWKIFDINVKENTIDLISETPTNARIGFQGTLAYNNGVYLLNDICKKLYSNEELDAIARSVNIEDIKDKTATDILKSASFRYEGKVIEYGDSIKVSNNKYYPYLWTKENKGGKIDGVKIEGVLGESEQTELLKEEEGVANNSIEIPQTYIEGKLEFKEKEYKSMLINNTWDYWLASRFSSIRDNDMRGSYWGLRKVEGPNLRSNEFTLRTVGNGNSSSIRPIVTISIDKIDMLTDYNEVGAWNLDVN